jgi:HEAT repeat protein
MDNMEPLPPDPASPSRPAQPAAVAPAAPQPARFGLTPVRTPEPSLAGRLLSAFSTEAFRHAAPWVAASYFAGVLLMVARLLLSLSSGRSLRAQARRVEDPALLALLQRAARAIRLRAVPAAAWCRQVAVPTVVGILKPAILLPLSLASGLSSEQIEMLLLHELAHLRRYDPWVNLVQRVIETALFFHPAVWWVSSRVRSERETACDDVVLAAGVGNTQYAESLLRMAEISRRTVAPERVSALAIGSQGPRPSGFMRRVLRLMENPDQFESIRLRRVWPFGVVLLAGTVAALVVTLALALALPLEEGYKASGEVVNGLQVSIEPQKKSYGLDEPILVHWKITNVSGKAQTILWHQEQQYLPVAFRYGKKGEKQTIHGNILALFGDHLHGRPEKLLLQPAQTKEAILDLRHFSMGLVEKDNKNLGMYKVAGLYTLKDTSSIIPSYLTQPQYRDVFADTVVSGDVAIELTDDLSWLKAQLSYGDVFASIKAARRLAPLIGNKAVLVELEKMYPTDNTRHMLHLVDVMAELGERSHVAEVLDMVEAGGYTPHLIDYGEDMLDFLLRWGEKRGVEYLQRYLIERPTVGYTNALERDRRELLRKITDIKTVKQSYLPLLIISLKDKDKPTPNAEERWCDKAGLAIQKLLGRDWGLGLEQTVEERDGVIGRMRAELADRAPALAERKQRVRFVERADGDEGGGYSNGLRFVANPVKRAVKQGEDVAFDLFVVSSGEPYQLFCIYPDTDWRWTSVVLQTSIGKRVEMTPPEPKAALRPIEKEDFVAIPPEKTIYWGRQTISQDWILPGGLPPGEHTFFVSLDKTDKMETTIPGYKEFCEKRFLHPWNGTPIAMTRSVTVVYDEKQAGAACWLEGSCTNKFPMNGRWNISRAKPVAVVVGWYAFDESGLVDHGGIATQNAASAVPLDLLFKARLYEGGLTLETSLNRIEKESDAGWPEPGRSASATDDIAVPSAPVLRTANPALKTTSLDALTSFGETLRPLWKVEIPRDGKSKLTLVYAVRALPENAPTRLFDPDNPAEALRVGREWSGLWPILYPPEEAEPDILAGLPEFHDQDTAAAPRAWGPPSDGVRQGASDNQPLALGLAPALELNKPTYDIGEPIIASLVIKNASNRKISLDTGGDYRSGRVERFHFQVRDDKGKAVPDPLKIFVSQNMAGGLGGGVDLAHGETYTVSALLNLYATPRAPGRYTLSGDYQVTQRMDDATSGRLTLPPVAFSVLSGSSGMSQEQGRALFSKYKLDGIHPCILYGLQDNTSHIPELIAMMEPKTAPPEGPFAPLAERNASFDAMESLVLMPDKAAVYRAIEKEIAARWPSSIPKDDYLFHPLGHIYRTAITPESLPIIEPSLDHTNAAVANLAFLTALSMGSAKALDRLPAALRSTDSSKRQFAREKAFQYLDRALGNPGMAIEGIPTQLVPKYGDALMEGFRQEEGDSARADTEAFPDILPFGYLLDFHFAHYRLWEAIGIAVESNSPLKHMAALRYLAMCGNNATFPPLEKDKIARLIPFARRQMQTHPDTRARALAMRCLGIWGDAESVPALTQALDAPEKPLRLAAAEALILLHHGPLLEKCIERLVEEDEARDPKHVIWVAQRLGMKNAGQSFHLESPGGVAATLPIPNNVKDSASDESPARSIREMRELRKAVLRRLSGGAPAGANPQTTLAGPAGIPLDVQRMIERLASPDPKEQAKAAELLGQIGPAASDALLSALDHANRSVRYRAVAALGRMKEVRAVQPLIIRLKDEDEDVRAQAAEALANIREPRAIEPLVATLGDQSWVRVHAEEALAHYGKPAVEPLIKALKEDNPNVRASAAKVLGRIKDPRAINPLMVALMDKDENVRMWAAAAFRQMKDPRAVERLLDLLNDRSQDVCIEAARALANLKDTRAVEPLLAAFKNDLERSFWGAAGEAALALGKIRDDRAFKPLTDALNHPDIAVRYYAAAGLGELGDRRAVEPLIPLLKDPDVSVRYTAAQALGHLKDTRAVEPLIGAMQDRYQVKHDGSFQYPHEAAYALGMIGDHRATQPLVSLLHDPDYLLRQRAADALGMLADPQAIGPLIDAIPYLQEITQGGIVLERSVQNQRNWGVEALKKITGQNFGQDAGKWREWRKAHPDFKPASRPDAETEKQVERTQADLDSLSIAMQAHLIDTNAYPERLYQLTTPVAYLSVLPEDPFATSDTQKLIRWKPDAKPAPLLYSIGPDRMDQGGAVVYDPTNGAASPGDIVRTLNPGEAKSHEEIHGAALGKQIQQDAPIEDLIKALESDNINQWSRATDFLALRKAESKPAVPALVRALGDPQKRESALYALREMGPGAAEAAPALIRGLGEWKDHHAARWGAAVALANIGEAATPALAEAAKNPDPIVSIWAHAALARNEASPAYDPARGTRSHSLLSPYDYYELVNPGYLPHLHAVGKHMASQDKRIASEALSAVQMIGPKAAPLLPMLCGILKLENPRLPQNDPRWITALDVLVAIGRPAADPAIPIIEQALKKYAIPPVQLCEALLSLDPGSQAALDGLEKYVANPPKGTIYDLPQAHALLLKHGRNAPEHLESLLKTLNGDDLRLSPLAAKWIMENSQDARTRRQALDKIFAIQDDPAADDWAKAVASEGLRQVTPEEKDALPRLIGLIRGIKDPAAQWQRLSTAVAGLGRFGPAAREALPDLNRLIQARNRRVRDAAREAIKAIGPASSTPSGNP